MKFAIGRRHRKAIGTPVKGMVPRHSKKELNPTGSRKEYHRAHGFATEMYEGAGPHVPQKEKDVFVAQLKEIGLALSAELARQRVKQLSERYEKRFPKAIEILEEKRIARSKFKETRKKRCGNWRNCSSESKAWIHPGKSLKSQASAQTAYWIGLLNGKPAPSHCRRISAKKQIPGPVELLRDIGLGEIPAEYEKVKFK